MAYHWAGTSTRLQSPDSEAPVRRVAACIAPRAHPRCRDRSVLALLLAVLACDRAGGEAAATARTERVTLGDTLVVRNLGGGGWADSLTLVEELRIGEEGGSDEYAFARVQELVVGGDGRIVVYDGPMKSLRQYDSTGRFVRHIGGEGAGPGEFRDVLAMTMLPDDRLLVRDPRLGRINVYDATGEPGGAWPLPSGLFTANALRSDSAGRSYAIVLTGEPNLDEPWPMGYARFDADGRLLDTLPVPTHPQETVGAATYEPRAFTVVHPGGGLVTAFSDRYAVHVPRAEGGVMRGVMRIERPGLPVVPVEGAERQEIDERFQALRRSNPMMRAPEPRPTPAGKAAFRQIAVAHDGRVWVRPHVPSLRRETPVDTTLPPERRPSSWYEPVVWDVFEADGEYLGRVHPPPRASLYAMRGDQVWGTIVDENDVPYVVRWRIVPAGP